MTLLLSLSLFVAATSLVPLALVRGDLRRRFVVLDAGVSALALALWLLLPRLSIGLEAAAALGAFMVAKRVALSLLLVNNHDSAELAWTPWKGALVAGAVYVALVPFVLRAPIDGDEPFYLLVTESIVRDGDVDLRNQFSALERSATRRTDLVPQPGDPVGPAGEQHSRHEPLFSLLLVPGYFVGGLHGAVVTIALLAALAVASILRLLSEEGYSRRTILIIFPLLAFGPPLLAYATRIWPEAPAVLLFSEALRAARQGRRARAGIAVVLMALLKLRFGIISIAIVAGWMLLNRASWKKALVVFSLLAIPAIAVLVIYPQIVAVRMFDPEDVFTIRNYLRGIAGLLVDGQAGLLFQAPFWLLGLTAVLGWRELGAGARLGVIAAAPYLLLLVPRSEWHGGWSPPLRYVVVFLPLFALLAAAALERITSRGAILAAAIWSAGLTLHGLAHPTSLFQIATGEGVWGRWLSHAWEADFSRLIPSLIRPNIAAVVAMVMLAAVAAWALVRRARPAVGNPSSALVAATFAVLLTTGFAVARKPGETVELEDAHVRHEGGRLYPEEFTVARFRFRGGWSLGEGERASFRFAGGRSTLWYSADAPATIDLGARRITLQPTAGVFEAVTIELPSAPDRYTLRCVKGALIVDRIAAQ